MAPGISPMFVDYVTSKDKIKSASEMTKLIKAFNRIQLHLTAIVLMKFIIAKAINI
jgi:hypothetical protein